MTLRIADIRVEWDRIKSDVSEVLHGERPEDVYAACRFGRASLVMADDGAFCVCRTEVDGFTGETVCWVWVLHGPPGTLRRNLDDFDDLARKNGAVVMRQASRIEAWSNMPGWVKGDTIYERRL